MKYSISARTVFLAVLVVLSAASYVYLNIQRQDETMPSAAAPSQLLEEMEELPTGNVLPDVRLLRKAFEVGKQYIPAN